MYYTTEIYRGKFKFSMNLSITNEYDFKENQLNIAPDTYYEQVMNDVGLHYMAPGFMIFTYKQLYDYQFMSVMYHVTLPDDVKIMYYMEHSGNDPTEGYLVDKMILGTKYLTDDIETYIKLDLSIPWFIKNADDL